MILTEEKLRKIVRKCIKEYLEYNTDDIGYDDRDWDKNYEDDEFYDNIPPECLDEGEQSASQWEDEKEIFFNALRNGRAEVDGDTVWTYYPRTEYSNDPRFIYYKAGDYRLTDDHFCVQHSPALDYYELKHIQDYAKKFGVDIEIPDWAFEELENGEPVFNPSLLK